MQNLELFLLVQLILAFGIAGLLWPEKLLPFFSVMMFPWRASDRMVRAHGVAAIGAYVLVVGRFFFA